MPRRLLLAFAMFAAVLVAPAAAHTPHDIIEAWGMSPDFPKDHTLFVALPRFNLMLRSTDGGESWVSCITGLSTAYVTQIVISPDFTQDRTLWCVEISGLYVSHDAGETWTQVLVPKGLQDITSLAVSPGYAKDGLLVAGTRKTGPWLSARGGSFVPLDVSGGSKDEAQVTSLVVAGGRVAGLLGTALVLSGPLEPGRANPVPARPIADVAGGAALQDAQCLALDAQGRAVIGSHAHGVVGESGPGFAPLGQLPKNANVLHLSVAADADGTRVLFASTADDGVLIRHGDGPWTASLDGFREPTHQTKLHFMGTMVSPAWASDHTVYACCFEGLYVSTDGGSKWRWLNTLHPQLARNVALSPHFAQDGTLWLSTYGAGLLRSDDRGHTLTATASGDWAFPDGIAVSPDWKREDSKPGAPLAPATGSVLVGTPNLLLLSRDGGATVAPCMPGGKGFPRYLAFAPDWPAGGTAFAFLAADSGRLKDNQFVRTADGGAHWAPTDLGSGYDIVFAPDWATSGRAWVAGAEGVMATADRGATFSKTSLPAGGINSISLAPGAGPGQECLAAVPRGQPPWLSRDGGTTWTKLPGTKALAWFVELSPDFAHDGLMFEGTATDGVWVSHDAGATWTRTPGGPRVALAMDLSKTFAQDHTLLVGAYEQPWISEDAGASWRAITVPVPPGYVPDPSREGNPDAGAAPAPRK